MIFGYNSENGKSYKIFNAWQFEQQANEVVARLPWVKKVNVTMSAQPAKPIFAGELPAGLQRISNIIAVSSCKVNFHNHSAIVFLNLYHIQYIQYLFSAFASHDVFLAGN